VRRSAIYQVVRDHCEAFAAQAAAWREGQGLPRFVDEEFRVVGASFRLSSAPWWGAVIRPFVSMR
jgi:hypothetical protein